MIHIMIMYGLFVFGIAGLAILAGIFDNKRKPNSECKKVPPDYIDKLPEE